MKALWRPTRNGRETKSTIPSLVQRFAKDRFPHGGLIVVRELDEHLDLRDLILQHLTDSSRGKNTQVPLANVLRQSVYSRM